MKQKITGDQSTHQRGGTDHDHEEIDRLTKHGGIKGNDYVEGVGATLIAKRIII